MLKSFKWAKLLIPAMLLTVMVGCDDDDPQQKVELSVDTETVSVESAGGLFKVGYALKGADAGEKPQVKCEDEWVNGFDLSVDGELSFNVAANEEETPREAIVELSYRDAIANFTVSQGGKPAPDMTIEIKEIYDAGVYYSIVPMNPEMTYVSMVTEKSYMDAYESDEAYFADELKFFQESAKASDQQLSEYLATILKKGTISGPAYRLKPEKDYYIYVYGLDTEGKRLTDIYKQEFKTIAVERSNVELKIDYVVSGTTVTMTITPSDPEQPYMYNAIAAASITGDNFLLNTVQSEIDQYIELYERLFGVPQDEAVKRFTTKGTHSQTFDGLDPDTEYVGYAVVVNNLGSICGDLVSKSFNTEQDKPKEEAISLSITSLSEREVSVQADPSMADHYVIGVDNTARWTGMTDSQIVEKLVAGYQWQAKGGEGKGSYTFYDLTPGTEYSIFAFGYVNGAATTDLCRLDFTTKEAAGVDIIFKAVFDKYFDGDALFELYGDKFAKAKGRAALPLSIVTEGSDACAEVYYLLFEGDYSNMSQYPDDIFMEDLMEYGEWEYKVCFFPEYDKPYTIIGFGANDDMAIGPLSRQMFKLTRDGVSPASEFPSDFTKVISKDKVKRNNMETISLSELRSTSRPTAEVIRTMPYKPVGNVNPVQRFVIK